MGLCSDVEGGMAGTATVSSVVMSVAPAAMGFGAAMGGRLGTLGRLSGAAIVVF